MIFQKFCSNCVIRLLKLILLSCRYKDQWSVVAMVTGLASYFYFHKLDDLTRIPKTLLCVNQFSTREVMMIQRQ